MPYSPISKANIGFVQSLHLKKNRTSTNFFLAEGDKICREIIVQKNIFIQNIIALPSWLQANARELQPFENVISEANEAQLKKISTLQTPNQALIVAKQFEQKMDWQVASQSISLYLNEVQDPGNVGTILRIADWFGIPFVFADSHCADWYNSKVLQASMGAFLRVKMLTMPFSELTAKLPDLPLYGTFIDGEDILQAKNLTTNGMIVIGNESKGIGPEIAAQVQRRLHIPRTGGAESLNAAVATGIVCAIFQQKKR